MERMKRISINFTSILSLLYAFGSRCPAAFYITKWEDENLYILFFRSIDESVKIKVSIVMTDNEPAYYSACFKVMGPAEKHLLCSWHIEKIWVFNLSAKIVNVENRCMIYKMLKVLLTEPTKDSFNKKLDMYLIDLQNDTELLLFYIFTLSIIM